jgi:hypothetical protein
MVRPDDQQYVIRREVLSRIKRAFEGKGIHFAPRQVTVHVAPPSTAAGGPPGPPPAALDDGKPTPAAVGGGAAALLAPARARDDVPIPTPPRS